MGAHSYLFNDRLVSCNRETNIVYITFYSWGDTSLLMSSTNNYSHTVVILYYLFCTLTVYKYVLD